MEILNINIINWPLKIKGKHNISNVLINNDFDSAQKLNDY